MGYEPHSLCFDAEDDTTILRYMDFAQLMSILKEDQLFFPSANLLNDPYEGTIPSTHRELREESDEIPSEWSENYLPRFREIVKNYTFISCWHMNNTESAAMWNQYLKSDYGVCIQSTVERLKSSISGSNSKIHISKVNYINFSSEYFEKEERNSIPSSISPFLHKRNNFKYEKELRAIIHTPVWRDSTEDSIITAERISDVHSELDAGDGRKVNIDKSELIEKIYLSPNADEWVSKLIRKMLSDYGVSDEKLSQSPMARPPSF